MTTERKHAGSSWYLNWHDTWLARCWHKPAYHIYTPMPMQGVNALYPHALSFQYGKTHMLQRKTFVSYKPTFPEHEIITTSKFVMLLDYSPFFPSIRYIVAILPKILQVELYLQKGRSVRAFTNHITYSNQCKCLHPLKDRLKMLRRTILLKETVYSIIIKIGECVTWNRSPVWDMDYSTDRGVSSS